MINSPLKILIAASGSGGHIFPALFIAEEFKTRSNSIQIEFVGTGRPLEKQLIDTRGFTRHEIELKGISGRGVKGIVDFFLKLPSAFFATWDLLSQVKPDLVIGVGGYASFFPVTVAKLRGIPTWIHEAEVVPGLTNRILAYYATKVSVAFEDAQLKGRKVQFTGHPLRAEIAQIKPKLGVEQPQNLLILGGSQGSKALDEILKQLSAFISVNGFSVWHQTRPENVTEMKENYYREGVEARVDSFIDNMLEAYNWSDLIIARSGAGSVAEVSIANRPAIFVPLPSSQANHQVVNANYLAKAGKAFLVEEGESFRSRLEAKLNWFLQNDNYKKMLEAPARSIPTDAAKRIVDGCMELLGER